MTKRISALFVAVLLTALLPSCFVVKEYERPVVVNSDHYRADTLAADSASLAALSWRELFTDTLLAAHIEEGLENNPDILIALEQLDIATAYLKQMGWKFAPNLSAGLSAGYSRLSENSQFGAAANGGLGQFELSATLSWEIDVWGKIRSEKKAVRAQYLQTEAAQRAVATQLVAGIAGTYFQLMALDEQKRIAENTLQIRQESIETLAALKQAGMATQVAVDQARAQYESARAVVVELDRNIRLLENALCLLKGREPRPVPRGLLGDTGLGETALQTGYPLQLLQNRPDVLAAEYALVNAFELTNVARASLYPSFNLSASAGFQSLDIDKFFSLNSLFASIAGSLLQPLINGRQLRTAYAVAQSQQEIAYLEFRKALLTASGEVSDALYNYEAATRQIELKTLEAAAYQKALGDSRELLNSGLANYLEVLNAQQNALTAELNVVEAQYLQNQAVIELYRALGGGWK